MSITLLISTYNRTPALQKSLERLSELTLPDEIIIVDDGGSDGCKEMLSGLSIRCPVRYLYNHRPGPNNSGQARNVGIRLACCEEVLITEPEVAFLTDVIAQLLLARKDFPENALFGATLKANQNGSAPNDATMVAGYPHYTLYRHSWLTEVGGYDESLPGAWGFEDVDLNHRMGENGHQTLFISAARAFHQWHPPRVDAGEANKNEVIVRAKVWPNDIVANSHRPWGTLISRPDEVRGST